MRKLEHDTYQKLKQDFANEIIILEKGLNTIVRCTQLLVEKALLLRKPNLRINLINANPEERCSVTHTILIYHAMTFLKAARLLLLTGYIVPSLSCLRTSFESIQNAHICLNIDEQAMKLLTGKQLEKKMKIDYPIQLDKKLTREIKSTLSSYGVHASFEALETQALYEGSVFVKENRATYEFLFLRNIYSFLTISLLLLDYLLDAKPFLKAEFPDAIILAKNMVVKIERIASRLKELSESNLLK